MKHFCSYLLIYFEVFQECYSQRHHRSIVLRSVFSVLSEKDLKMLRLNNPKVANLVGIRNKAKHCVAYFNFLCSDVTNFLDLNTCLM